MTKNLCARVLVNAKAGHAGLTGAPNIAQIEGRGDTRVAGFLVLCVANQLGALSWCLYIKVKQLRDLCLISIGHKRFYDCRCSRCKW